MWEVRCGGVTGQAYVWGRVSAMNYHCDPCAWGHGPSGDPPGLKHLEQLTSLVSKTPGAAVLCPASTSNV